MAGGMDMAAMVLTTVTKLRWPLIMAGVIASNSVPAAELGASITVGLSNTDNALLVPSPDEVEDRVLWLSPTIDFTHESASLDANLRYRLDWYKFDELDETSTFHMGELSITPKFWQENLEFEVGARRAQVLRSPTLGIQPGRLPITNNLVDRDEVFANPRLDLELGRAVSLLADYRYTEGSYDDPVADIQDDTIHDGRFSVDNYRSGRGLTWAARYNYRKTEYEVSPPWEYQQAGIEAGFWVNSEVRVFASGGQESAWDDPVDTGLSDPFWEVGLARDTGDRFTAVVAVGERSFGPSWRGNLEFEFRRGSTSLSYSETPTTTAFNLNGPRLNVIDPDDFVEFLDTPGEAERFVLNRLEWNLQLDYRRTDVEVVVFSEDRTERLLADGSFLPDQWQRGAGISFVWEAGRRTDLGLSGTAIRRDDGEFNSSDFMVASASITYRLHSRSNLTLSYEYAKEEPREDSVSTIDYVSNVVTLAFTYSL